MKTSWKFNILNLENNGKNDSEFRHSYLFTYFYLHNFIYIYYIPIQGEGWCPT